MCKFDYNNEIAMAVKGYLDKDNWHYSFNEESGIFEFALKTDCSINTIHYFIDIHRTEMLVYGICPVCVSCDDADKMAEMAEFVAKANNGLKNGNFEFNYANGEIRYKSYVDCSHAIPSYEVVMNCICCIAMVYKRYAEGVLDIVSSDATASESIQRCDEAYAEELRQLFFDKFEANDEKIEKMIEELLRSIERN